MKVTSIFKPVLLIVVCACLLWACSKPNASTSQVNAADSVAQSPEKDPLRIKAEEAKKLVEDGKAVIVDVRGSEAYRIAHIKGALDASLSRLQGGDFKDLPKDKRIITYCTCGAEQTSAAAARVLEKAGYKEASALLGGMAAWETAGGELVKSTPDKPAKN